MLLIVFALSLFGLANAKADEQLKSLVEMLKETVELKKLIRENVDSLVTRDDATLAITTATPSDKSITVLDQTGDFYAQPDSKLDKEAFLASALPTNKPREKEDKKVPAISTIPVIQVLGYEAATPGSAKAAAVLPPISFVASFSSVLQVFNPETEENTFNGKEQKPVHANMTDRTLKKFTEDIDGDSEVKGDTVHLKEKVPEKYLHRDLEPKSSNRGSISPETLEKTIEPEPLHKDSVPHETHDMQDHHEQYYVIGWHGIPSAGKVKQ